jgi:dnd system-associated protein 4
MQKIPDRFYIDKDDRKLYEKIEEEDMFKGRARKEEFLFAMAIGFKNKIHRPLNKRENFFLTKDLKPEDETLINALAIKKHNSVEVLSNKEGVFKIAEEYAHGGIKILSDEIESTQFGSFSKQFEKMLHEIYEELMNERV